MRLSTRPITHIRRLAVALFIFITPMICAAQPMPTRPTADSMPVSDDFEPIDLATALRLATTSSLDVARAQAVVEQARAARQRALVRWLPDAALLGDYINHGGRIQQANGNILNTSRDSLFVGGGPSLNLALSDALFGPLVARQLLNASEAGLQRVTNDNLLAVAEAYLQLLRARRRIARTDFTLVFLTDEKSSPLRGNSPGLLPLMRATVEAGAKTAFRADLARTQVEVVRRQEERANAIQELRVASRDLSRLLRLDPTVPLWPVDDISRPLPVPGEDLANRDIHELIATAMANRPELAEQQFVTNATRERIRAARVKPFVPNVIANLSYAGFGGGPVRDPAVKFNDPFSGPIDNPITPPDSIHRFGPRTDFELGLVWRVDNLGFGNAADVREKRAVFEQARIRLQQVEDFVAAQSRSSVRQSCDRVIEWPSLAQPCSMRRDK